MPFLLSVAISYLYNNLFICYRELPLLTGYIKITDYFE